ncbi:MAG: ComF family protein [Paludibacteraceae bacterium]|nr:ComF family protein [Paludibacteraceae bacterium]
MVSAIHTALFNVLFPHLCPMCGSYCERICDKCISNLPRTEQDVLRDNCTEDALADVAHLKRAAAFMFFEKEHPVQLLIHKMKYADQPLIGYQLGRQAAQEFLCSDFFDGVQLIIPVPLHRNRLRSRGYNQSEYIARAISEVTGIPIDTTHVTREKDTPQQALQTGEERKNNVADAFAVNHPEQLYHKHILLVDDLITTGETVKACLRAMRTIRGATFSVFALGKAR